MQILRVVVFVALGAGCKKSEPSPVVVESPVSPVTTRSEPTGRAVTASKVDDVEIIELVPQQGKLRDQLRKRRDAASGRVFIVETTAEWCRPCKGVTKYLRDPAMTKALTGATLVRVNYDEFSADELKSCGIPHASLPWFVMFDRDLRITDAITSSEWDEDIPANMAPVLSAFVHGTLSQRRSPWRPGR